MAKRTDDTRTVGRAQGGRPQAGADAHKHSQAERTLVGALAVPIEQIIPDPKQPRTDLAPARVADLSASIKEYGVLQPLLVREHGLLDDGRTQYMIVAGGRRYTAAQLAGLAELPVVVRESTDAARRMTQLVENIQRQDLAPLEEARAFMEIMDANGITAETLAERLHISGQTVRDRVLLLSDQPMADAVQRGQVGPTVARDILRTADEPQAILRDLIGAGEVVTKATVKEVRERATAAGVKNARAKGGGRRKVVGVAEDTSPSVPVSIKDHNGYDLAAGEIPKDDIGEALAGIDHGAAVRLLSFGSMRQWTCQQLLETINERMPDAAR